MTRNTSFNKLWIFGNKTLNKTKEHGPELIEKATSFVKLTEGFRVTETGIRPSAVNEDNEYGTKA